MKKTPMTSTELVQWLKDGCFDGRFADAFDSGEEGDIHSVFDHYTAEERDALFKLPRADTT